MSGMVEEPNEVPSGPCSLYIRRIRKETPDVPYRLQTTMQTLPPTLRARMVGWPKSW